MSQIDGLEQLYIFPNFLDEDEINLWNNRLRAETFWKEIPASDHEHSTQRNHISIDGDNMRNDLSLLQDNEVLVSKINAKVEQIFGEQFLTPTTLYYRKWVAGMTQGLHHDACYEYGAGLDWRTNSEAKESAFPIAFHDVATVLYYNDDFEGGEIFFHRPNISLKPERGMLIMMPCTDRYIHGVNEITSGERYISAHFWTRAKTIAMCLGHDKTRINEWIYKYSDCDKVDRLLSDMRRH